MLWSRESIGVSSWVPILRSSGLPRALFYCLVVAVQIAHEGVARPHGPTTPRVPVVWAGKWKLPARVTS